MLGKTLVCITYSVLYVFANELFPTEVRNVGVGTASMSARLSSMSASFVGGPLVSQSAVTVHYLFISCCVVDSSEVYGECLVHNMILRSLSYYWANSSNFATF